MECTKVNFYSAYGLTIQSVLPLPELTPLAEAEPDVVIRFGKLDTPSFINPACNDDSYFAEGEAYLYWKQIGTFLVREGREIVIDLNPGVDKSLVRLPLLGTVLAV